MTSRSWPSYDGKRVLVTGHTGFKGSWITFWLRRLGAEVGGLSLAPQRHQQPLFDALGGSHALEYELIADIRDRKAPIQAIQEFEPHLVVHMAAQPLVRESYSTPVETFDTNVMGTAHVLDAARRAVDALAGVVVVTTDKCYENREQIWPYRESDAMGGYDPYSASKGAAEIVVSSYSRSFFSSDDGALLASARAGNVIGGGDFAPDRLIPDLVRAVRDGDSMTIRSPDAVRPWQHVLEPLSGYLEVGHRMLEADHVARGAWNFGPHPHESETVRGILAYAEGVLGDAAPSIALEKAAQPHEANLLLLDITKANTLLGWNPVFDNQERIGATIEWYMAFLESSDELIALSERQIDQVESRLLASHG